MGAAPVLFSPPQLPWISRCERIVRLFHRRQDMNGPESWVHTSRPCCWCRASPPELSKVYRSHLCIMQGTCHPATLPRPRLTKVSAQVVMRRRFPVLLWTSHGLAVKGGHLSCVPLAGASKAGSVCITRKLLAGALSLEFT